MKLYNNDRKQTQEIKQFIKPHKQNKVMESDKVKPKEPTRTLPIRGQN